MSAPAGVERLNATYDAAAGPKDALAVFDVGVNTSISLPPGSQLRNFVPAGMVTLFFGNDQWAGGTNATSFALQLFLPGTTVSVGDTPLIEGGTLRMTTAAP